MSPKKLVPTFSLVIAVVAMMTVSIPCHADGDDQNESASGIDTSIFKSFLTTVAKQANEAGKISDAKAKVIAPELGTSDEDGGDNSQDSSGSSHGGNTE